MLAAKPPNYPETKTIKRLEKNSSKTDMNLLSKHALDNNVIVEEINDFNRTISFDCLDKYKEESLRSNS